MLKKAFTIILIICTLTTTYIVGAFDIYASYDWSVNDLEFNKHMPTYYDTVGSCPWIEMYIAKTNKLYRIYVPSGSVLSYYVSSLESYQITWSISSYYNVYELDLNTNTIVHTRLSNAALTFVSRWSTSIAGVGVNDLTYLIHSDDIYVKTASLEYYTTINKKIVPKYELKKYEFGKSGTKEYINSPFENISEYEWNKRMPTWYPTKSFVNVIEWYNDEDKKTTRLYLTENLKIESVGNNLLISNYTGMVKGYVYKYEYNHANGINTYEQIEIETGAMIMNGSWGFNINKSVKTKGLESEIDTDNEIEINELDLVVPTGYLIGVYGNYNYLKYDYYTILETSGLDDNTRLYFNYASNSGTAQFDKYTTGGYGFNIKNIGKLDLSVTEGKSDNLPIYNIGLTNYTYKFNTNNYALVYSDIDVLSPSGEIMDYESLIRDSIKQGVKDSLNDFVKDNAINPDISSGVDINGSSSGKIDDVNNQLNGMINAINGDLDNVLNDVATKSENSFGAFGNIFGGLYGVLPWQIVTVIAVSLIFVLIKKLQG